MLTKEEREGIAKRLNYCGDTEYYSFYRAVTGHNTTTKITLDEDVEELEKVISNLCDTSNMVELPLDKDGEVIRIGDTVYDKDGEEYKVTGYRILFDDADIFLSNGSEPAYTTVYTHYVTHKKPVTIKSLLERIKRVMDDDSTTVWAYDELDDIADQLERLGDNDE
jgi:hypothetical protein